MADRFLTLISTTDNVYVCVHLCLNVRMPQYLPCIHTIVLREDDNSEKTNSYIDAAIGKREPVEKVSCSITIYLVHIVLHMSP